MKNFFSNLFGLFSTPWWVKITTAEPSCIYYFGPFDSEAEAIAAKPGYVEDLKGEGAQQIQTSLHHGSEPKELTVELEASLQSSVMMTA
ncbi:MAG: DUF1816 domain-containing protein [Phormidesmis sp.]